MPTNIRLFIAFRILFNARFYYPIFTILFLDMGLTLEQFALLNTVWAATIVLMEVPSGALADLFGRRRLLVVASYCMVIEMMIMAFVPLGNATVVFWALCINRMISGAAEALASGADEALAYDSLPPENREKVWSSILEKLMRYQSGAFVVAMLTGSLVYDSSWMPSSIGIGDWSYAITPERSLRFPLYLNVLTALGVLFVTHRLKEDFKRPDISGQTSPVLSAFIQTQETGKWILKSPIVLVLIVAGMIYDSSIRMILTLQSEYYRAIEIPEAFLGFLGAGLSLLGMVLSPLAKRMTESFKATSNFAALGVYVFFGLYGMTWLFPFWGILPAIVVGSGMFFLGFFMSYYLNKSVDSTRRATVLSFKGLACNLAYGVAGLLYMLLTYTIRNQGSGNNVNESWVFESSLQWFPGYFVLTILLLVAFSKYIIGRNPHRV